MIAIASEHMSMVTFGILFVRLEDTLDMSKAVLLEIKPGPRLMMIGQKDCVDAVEVEVPIAAITGVVGEG